MLTQKEIQAQLKVNRETLSFYLGEMEAYEYSALCYKNGLTEACKFNSQKTYNFYRSLYNERIGDYQKTKSKFLTLSAVQAKLKRMLANTARADAKSKEMKNV